MEVVPPQTMFVCNIHSRYVNKLVIPIIMFILVSLLEVEVTHKYHKLIIMGLVYP